MWKNITGNLYSPPTFIHRDESPTVFKYTLDNTVEDVTNLPTLTTYIAKLQFEEINPLIFQDLKPGFLDIDYIIFNRRKILGLDSFF